jgi:hypothetical protein
MKPCGGDSSVLEKKSFGPCGVMNRRKKRRRHAKSHTERFVRKPEKVGGP